jgi:hypothetical protein
MKPCSFVFFLLRLAVLDAHVRRCIAMVLRWRCEWPAAAAAWLRDARLWARHLRDSTATAAEHLLRELDWLNARQQSALEVCG